MLYIDTWTVEIYTTALPGSNVKIAAMSICWPFHASGGISAPPATRNG